MDQRSRGLPSRRGEKGYSPWPGWVLGGFYPSRGYLFYTREVIYRKSITIVIRTPEGDLAVVLQRNLVISQGLRVVDALPLVLYVQEVLNFDQWE